MYFLVFFIGTIGFDSICDFIEGFIEGWSGEEGLATEFGPEITANSVGFILLIFVVLSHIAKKLWVLNEYKNRYCLV